jgi:hypothetical protein
VSTGARGAPREVERSATERSQGGRMSAVWRV